MKKTQFFLNSQIKAALNPEPAGFHIIPAPFERTVSYGKGARQGPAAIIDASQYLEFFPNIRKLSDFDIYTAPPIKQMKSGIKTFDAIANTALRSLKFGATPVLLGGEHTVSYGLAKALRLHFEEKTPIGIIHFDAHADLRNIYNKNKFNHACVMRRIHEDFKMEIFQIGTRGYCAEEATYRKKNDIRYLDSRDLFIKKNLFHLPPADFPEKIYISFDLDALDPSIMPSTGTPEPGGLLWQQTLDIIAKIAAKKQIIAFDIVELAPVPKIHHPDYTAAKLTLFIMQLIKSKSEKKNER